MPRESNWEADDLTQVASGVQISEELTHKLIEMGKNNHPSIYERGSILEAFNTNSNFVRDLRIKIGEYLEDLNMQVHQG